MYKKYSKPLIVVIIGIIFFVLTVLFRNFLNISAGLKHTYNIIPNIRKLRIKITLKVIVKSVFLCLSSFNDRFIFESTKVNEFELILKLGFVKDFLFLINIESV